jgi:hypothetical protein
VNLLLYISVDKWRGISASCNASCNNRIVLSLSESILVMLCRFTFDRRIIVEVRLAYYTDRLDAENIAVWYCDLVLSAQGASPYRSDPMNSSDPHLAVSEVADCAFVLYGRFLAEPPLIRQVIYLNTTKKA